MDRDKIKIALKSIVNNSTYVDYIQKAEVVIREGGALEVNVHTFFPNNPFGHQLRRDLGDILKESISLPREQIHQYPTYYEVDRRAV